MILRDVAWAEPTNILVVECCGTHFAWPSHVSCVQCPLCRKVQLWHGVGDVEKGDIWDLPVMEYNLR